MPPKADPPLRIGYLTYIDLSSLGTVGGLLLVDGRARPIEFHCSAPILPSRTQEILYGRTLRAALLCDQIGKSLTEQLEEAPSAILTNESTALGLRELVDVPVIVLSHADAMPTSTQGSADESRIVKDGICFSVGEDATQDSRPQDLDIVPSLLAQASASWDWMEPIDRIREAVREAHRAAA